jgi:hypothetical protein
MALLAGVPPSVVAETLGHTSTALVHSTYGHIVPVMRADQVAKIQRLYAPSQAPLATAADV